MSTSTDHHKAAIKVIDQFSGHLFGAQLEKAELAVFPVVNGGMGPRTETLKFFLNPHTISVERKAEYEMQPHTQGHDDVKYKGTKPICVNIGELWFDTYDERKSVRTAYIDKLEQLVDYDVSTHYTKFVALVWGQFTQATAFNPQWLFFVESVKTEYTMFLPDATPVRAKVALHLIQATTAKFYHDLLPKESPDHAKLYTVKRGDTLPGIAAREYHNPGEWRRIANTNKLDDPMNLRPGMQLLVPPILK